MSVPLDHCGSYPACGVQLQCLGCELTRDFDLERGPICRHLAAFTTRR